MKKFSARIGLLLSIGISLSLTSCDENTDYIGSTLTDDNDRLSVFADTFNILSQTIAVDSVLGRTSTGYLGRVSDPETGTYITGDFMAQYGILEGYAFPTEESIVSRLNGKIIADSCEIRLFCNSFFGDSLAVMKLRVHELETPMSENTFYYSSYSPLKEGLVRTAGLSTSKIYTLANQAVSDEERSESDYVNYIHIPLNMPYTDKAGRTYNNYGSYLLANYYETPEFYRNSYQFIHNLAPGFFFEYAGGIGSMAYITNSQINIYFRYEYQDSVYNGTLSFAATEEVLQTTHISNDKSLLNILASDPDYTYLKTPAALLTQLTLPIDEITGAHAGDSINSAKITLQRVNNKTLSDYALNTPNTLLLLPADSVTSFFEKGLVTDNKTSFLSTYTVTKTATNDANTYTFNNISNLVSYLSNIKKQGLRSDPQWIEKHPNWNKVMVVPVVATYISTQNPNTGQTVQTIYRVRHDMSLSSTRLSNRNIKISVVYGKM